MSKWHISSNTLWVLSEKREDGGISIRSLLTRQIELWYKTQNTWKPTRNWTPQKSIDKWIEASFWVLQCVEREDIGVVNQKRHQLHPQFTAADRSLPAQKSIPWVHSTCLNIWPSKTVASMVITSPQSSCELHWVGFTVACFPICCQNSHLASSVHCDHQLGNPSGMKDHLRNGNWWLVLRVIDWMVFQSTRWRHIGPCSVCNTIMT